jgi:hypothetical protein
MTTKKVTAEDIEVREEWIALANEIYSRPMWSFNHVIAAVLAAISNDPPRPSPSEMNRIHSDWQVGSSSAFAEWLRIAFLKSEPVVPEEIKELLWPEDERPTRTKLSAMQHNQEIIAAFNAGARSIQDLATKEAV